jgi:inner membrane protein
MDSITQAALGATIAQAGFSTRLGRRALLFGAVAATLPDLDVVVRAAGQWAVVEHHRGATHSLPVLALATPLLALAGRRWFARPRDRSGAAVPDDRRAWLLLTALVLLTHPLLDLFTSYGTQLFWPLSGRRFALDAISIIDPVVTVPMLLVVARGFMGRAGPRLALAVLCLTMVYLGYGHSQSRRAEAIATAELARQDFEPVEVRALPTPANLVVWRVVARDAGGRLRVTNLSTAGRERPRFVAAHRGGHPLAERALASPEGRLFEWFAMDMISTTVEETARGTRVLIHDHRYGMISDPLITTFRAEAEFDDGGRLLGVYRPMEYMRGDMRREISLLWRMIRNDA